MSTDQGVTKLGLAVFAALDSKAKFVGIRGYQAQPKNKWAARASSKGRVDIITKALVTKRDGGAPTFNDPKGAHDPKAEDDFNDFCRYLDPTGKDEAEIRAFVEAGVLATGEVMDLVLATHINYEKAKARDAKLLTELAGLTIALEKQNNVSIESLGLNENVVKKAFSLVGKGLAITAADYAAAIADILAEKTGERARSASIDAREAHYEQLLGNDGEPILGFKYNKTEGTARIYGFVASKTVTTKSNTPFEVRGYRTMVSAAAEVVRALLPTGKFREYILKEGNFKQISVDGITMEARHFPGQYGLDD